MMLLKIVQYPDPILKQKSTPVEEINKETRNLVSNMFETMYASNGVGLAAPQIGINKRILVIDVGKLENETTKPNPIALINPEFQSSEGKIVWEEGCLSLPNLLVEVERSAKVHVTGKDADGKDITILGEQLLAVALQHEIDHLNGIVLADRLSRMKRDLYLNKLNKNEQIDAPVPKGQKPYLG
jgi:peptide deformylase